MIVLRKNATDAESYILETDGVMSFADHNQQFGYKQEYVEKLMMSGRIRRLYKGKRFQCTVRFGWLPPVTIGGTTYPYGGLHHLLDMQQINGWIYATIDSPTGVWSGYAYLDLNDKQKRFKWDPNAGTSGAYVWSDFQLTITARDLD